MILLILYDTDIRYLYCPNVRNERICDPAPIKLCTKPKIRSAGAQIRSISLLGVVLYFKCATILTKGNTPAAKYERNIRIPKNRVAEVCREICSFDVSFLKIIMIDIISQKTGITQ